MKQIGNSVSPSYPRVGDVDLGMLRIAARRWMKGVEERRRQAAAWSFTAAAIAGYVKARGERLGRSLKVSPLSLALTYKLDQWVQDIADEMGSEAARLPFEEASYQLCATYTGLLPEALRSSLGAYYTPPPLTTRLLDLAGEAGVDWASARVLDPASGGGAFLVPVALRMRERLSDVEPNVFLEHLSAHLAGFEIDPFAAWLTQVWLEIAFANEAKAADRSFPSIVQVCDALDQLPASDGFDLVIGNPPYGRVTLAPHQRECYRRSLYGHANLYGVFTDLAIRWTKPGGVIAYVTPTSFLAGQYFKALRGLLSSEAPPVAVDFLQARRGVFQDVLQEAVLATYRREGKVGEATVHFLGLRDGRAQVEEVGSFRLPVDESGPWIAPREPHHRALAEQLTRMPNRLADLGYKVATGPLVWNRHKDQLRNDMKPGTYPLIWAESVTSDGSFRFRATKRNHSPYFQTRKSDEWLKVVRPCVLLQRTTAKEQTRRLIAAELPAEFIALHGAVIVENHLNMICSFQDKPVVSPATLSLVLNSRIVDQAFRCISGSVAVSAYELEALPLPSLGEMEKIDQLVICGAAPEKVHAVLETLYAGECG